MLLSPAGEPKWAFPPEKGLGSAGLAPLETRLLPPYPATKSTKPWYNIERERVRKMTNKGAQTIERKALSRRGFLGLGANALALPFLTRISAFASSPSYVDALPPDRSLSFYNTHTGESEAVAYCRSGCLVPASLEKIDHILRDHRTGETKPMDARLLDLLHALARKTGADAPFHVISGYRSPQTNAALRGDGGGGVASNSLHLVGKAIDIRVPGIKLRDLYRAAVDLRGGGVGIYPGSDFVHIDVGRVRTW